MWKIWPWKEVADSLQVKGQTIVLKTHNIWPPDLGTNTQIAIGLGLLGVLMVLGLDKLGNRKTEAQAPSTSS
jgi:putative membrane protein